VGALTNKLYAYKGRPWELKSVETIAINDGYFSLIKVDLSERKILRILPIIGAEEWIDDSTRFFKSEPRMKSSLAKLTYKPIFHLVNFMLQEEYAYHKKKHP